MQLSGKGDVSELVTIGGQGAPWAYCMAVGHQDGSVLAPTARPCGITHVLIMNDIYS